MNSTTSWLVPGNLASFLYSPLFVFLITDFSSVIKICQFSLTSTTCLNCCCPHPHPSLAHLVLLTLDWSLQLTLYTTILGVVLMCILEHHTPPAHSKVSDGPHGYRKLQSSSKGHGQSTGFDTADSVETLHLGPTKPVSLPNLALCLLTSREMMCYY